MTSLTLAALLNVAASGSTTQLGKPNTYILPRIAGQWLAILDDDSIVNNMVNDTSVPKQPQKLELSDDWHDNVHDQPRAADDKTNAKASDRAQNNANSSDNADSISRHSYSSGHCRELYTFDKDNRMRTSSGTEITHGHYIVLDQQEGLPILIMTTNYDNNEVDCLGNQIDQTGERVVAYLKEEGNTMQWCGDKLGQQCSIRFERILP